MRPDPYSISAGTCRADAPSLVPSSYVHESVDFATYAGQAATQLLAQAGIDPAPDSAVSPEIFGEVWRVLGGSLDDLLLGFGDRPMPVEGAALLGHSVLHAGTVDEALRRALAFLRIAIGRPAGTLRVRGSRADVVLDEDGPPRSLLQYHLFWILLGGFVGWLAGRRIPLHGADLRCTEGHPDDDLSARIRAPARFGQSQTCFSFDSAHLRLPVIRDEAALRRFLRQCPTILLIRHWHDQGLATRVRERLNATPPPFWPSFEQLADAMAMPATTLRRRLRAEGHSYRAIKDDIRHARALALLRDGLMSVSDVAEQLGFLEPSAFHRAFRKWTSSTPATFRYEPRSR